MKQRGAQVDYEKPTISDYGNLVELTANLDAAFDGYDGKTPS
jgi:hypothetical protein